MADGEEDVIIAVGLYPAIKKKRLKKRRRMTLSPLNQEENEERIPLLFKNLGWTTKCFKDILDVPRKILLCFFIP